MSSEEVSVKQRTWVADQSKWWKPLSSVSFRTEQDVTYQRQTENSWFLGLQTDARTGKILKHNYWFYYFVITGMLASLYIYLLLGKLMVLTIPEESLFFLPLLFGSMVMFLVVFIGLMCYMIYVEAKCLAEVPQASSSSATLVIYVGIPMVLYIIGLITVVQYIQTPLVLVGLGLLGIDLMIFCYIFGIMREPSYAVIKAN